MQLLVLYQKTATVDFSGIFLVLADEWRINTLKLDFFSQELFSGSGIVVHFVNFPF